MKESVHFWFHSVDEIFLSERVLTKNDEGAEGKHQDEEQQHTNSNSFPRGWSWPVHLSWEA